jgi:hypothetical protein
MSLMVSGSHLLEVFGPLTEEDARRGPPPGPVADGDFVECGVNRGGLFAHGHGAASASSPRLEDVAVDEDEERARLGPVRQVADERRDEPVGQADADALGELARLGNPVVELPSTWLRNLIRRA